MSKYRGVKHIIRLDDEIVWEGAATGEKEALDKFHEELLEDGKFDTLEEFAGSRGLTFDDFAVTSKD